MSYSVKWDGTIHKESFGRCFRSYRLRLGLGGKEFAEKAGVCCSYISDIENDFLGLSAGESVGKCVSALGLSENEKAEPMGMLPEGKIREPSGQLTPTQPSEAEVGACEGLAPSKRLTSLSSDGTWLATASLLRYRCQHTRGWYPSPKTCSCNGCPGSLRTPTRCYKQW